MTGDGARDGASDGGALVGLAVAARRGAAVLDGGVEGGVEGGALAWLEDEQPAPTSTRHVSTTAAVHPRPLATPSAWHTPPVYRLGTRGRTEVSKGGLTVSAMDKMKNKAEDLTGKGKESVGDATGNEDMKAEGEKDQASGNLKQAGENVKDAFK